MNGGLGVVIKFCFVHSCYFGGPTSRNTAAFHVAFWPPGRSVSPGDRRSQIREMDAPASGQVRLFLPLLGTSRCLAKPNRES